MKYKMRLRPSSSLNHEHLRVWHMINASKNILKDTYNAGRNTNGEHITNDLHGEKSPTFDSIFIIITYSNNFTKGFFIDLLKSNGEKVMHIVVNNF